MQRRPPSADIVWLLNFIERDLGNLRRGEEIDLGDQLGEYFLNDDPARLELDELLVETDEDDEVPFTLTSLVRESVISGLQDFLRSGVEAFEKGVAWEPFDVALPLWVGADWGGNFKLELQWVYEPQGDGTIRRSYRGHLLALVVVPTADLLADWWPFVRRCRHEPCNRLFVPKHGRQRFHSPSCSLRARQKKHALKRKPKRDYREEYKQRVKRKLGPNVKVKQQSRKGGA